MLENQFVIVSIGAIAVVGIVVCWVGSLAAMLTALGKRRWLWAIPILLLGPLVALPYSFVDTDANYARSLVIKGFAIAVPAGLILGAIYLTA